MCTLFISPSNWKCWCFSISDTKFNNAVLNLRTFFILYSYILYAFPDLYKIKGPWQVHTLLYSDFPNQLALCPKSRWQIFLSQQKDRFKFLKLKNGFDYFQGTKKCIIQPNTTMEAAMLDYVHKVVPVSPINVQCWFQGKHDASATSNLVPARAWRSRSKITDKDDWQYVFFLWDVSVFACPPFCLFSLFLKMKKIHKGLNHPMMLNTVLYVEWLDGYIGFSHKIKNLQNLCIFYINTLMHIQDTIYYTHAILFP